MRVLEFLQGRAQRQIIGLGAAFIVLIGLLDYWTGSELSFSIFYLLPIALVTWYAGDRAGLLAAATSAVAWLLADLSAGRVYSSSAIPYWNALVRFGIFSIITYTLHSLRAARLRQDELSQFVVHDLRSPLGNTLAGLTLIQETAASVMDEEDRKLLQIAIASCNRMMSLVNSLLDLAKLESGKMTLNRQEMATNDLFETAILQVRAMAVRGEVEVGSRVEAGAERVYVDSEMTVRVLVNLLGNALKYSPTQGSVTIQAGPDTNGMVAIRVIDQGPGIPKEWASKVFAKYAQVEARKAGVAVGSGLGLSFCELAVHNQGGRIWIESEVGRGTTVIFTLPRHPQS